VSTQTPATKPTISRNTVLLVVFSLLLCCGLPILPIYLWRKGKLPAWAGIGLAIAWVALYGVAIATAPEPKDDPKTEPTATKSTPTPTPKATPTESPATSKPSPTVDTAAVERAALVAKAEKLVLAELPDVSAWDGVTAKGIYVSTKKVCVDRTYGPDGGLGGNGGNAGYVVVTFPEGDLGEPQDGTCAKEGSAPAPTVKHVDVPDSLKNEPGLLVSTDYGDDWPLTVEYGVVKCQNRTIGGRQLQVVTFVDPMRKTWAVNGTAQAQTDYPEIDPIWADDPELEGAKINISPVIDRGLELCD
jgi:hypothetical protein